MRLGHDMTAVDYSLDLLLLRLELYYSSVPSDLSLAVTLDRYHRDWSFGKWHGQAYIFLRGGDASRSVLSLPLTDGVSLGLSLPQPSSIPRTDSLSPPERWMALVPLGRNPLPSVFSAG